MSFFASPQRDEALLREAGVTIDRALFPLLVRLAVRQANVAELAGQVGRDHTTVSRQLGKLERLGLAARHPGAADRRVHNARLTPDGERIVHAIAAARRRLLSRALAAWTDADLASLATLNRRLVQTLADASRVAGQG